MNTVLTLAGSASGGLINILLVLVLVVAAILLIIAVYLIRSSRRSVSKHAYEPQVAQYHVQDAPYQDADLVASNNQSEGWQQRPVISQPLTVPDALKQCPFCGTDVMPGGIFCLYCGQRLPIPTPPGSPFPASQPDEAAQKPELISSNRPSLSSFDEIDEALARAVEERPARVEAAVDEQPTQVEEAVVVAKPSQPLEEQPTQTGEALVEAEKPLEEQPTRIGEALAEPAQPVEEQPTRVEEAVEPEKQEEPEQVAQEEEAPAEAEPPVEEQATQKEAIAATDEPEQQAEEPPAEEVEAPAVAEPEQPEEAVEAEQPVEEPIASMEETAQPVVESEKPEEDQLGLHGVAVGDPALRGLRRHRDADGDEDVGFDTTRIALELEEINSRMVHPLKLSVMGCYVNGPGEAAEADLGVVASGTTAKIYQRGKLIETLVPFDRVIPRMCELIESLTNSESNSGVTAPQPSTADSSL